MSALDETGTVGKSTQGSGRLPVSDATRRLFMVPQLPYGDAVHAALAAIEVVPDLVETGVRTEGIRPGDGRRPRYELFLRLEWLPGHDDLVPDDVIADGLIVQWSHLTGWSVRSGEEYDALEDADPIASPAVVADAALHAAVHGPCCGCERPDPAARWEHALHLDLALARFDEHRGQL